MKMYGRWPGVSGMIPFVALGLFFIGGGTLHALTHVQTPSRTVSEVVVPVFSGLILLYASYRVSTSRMSNEDALRMLSVTLLLLTIALSVSGFNMAIDVWMNQPVSDPVYSVLVSSGAGASVGSLLGFYYTQLRESHRRLNTQYQNARTLNKRLSVVQRVLRHNLRNELTVIGGVTDMLNDDPSTAEVERYVRMLDDHVTHLYEITETAKQLEQVWDLEERERVDVVAVVRKSLAAVEHTHEAVAVELSAPATAPAVVHPMFPDAVDELVENAVEHNTPEELELTVSVHTGVGVDDRTRVEISDTGTGIPPIEVTALGQSREEPLSHGVGLGLWFVYSVVTCSQGEVSFEENTPSGTRVVIEVPSPDTEQSTQQRGSVLFGDVLRSLKGFVTGA